MELHHSSPAVHPRAHHASRQSNYLAARMHLLFQLHASSFPTCCHACVGSARSPMICQKIADRKSTRLNSSHLVISYAVFCLKKKNDFYLSNCSTHRM